MKNSVTGVHTYSSSWDYMPIFELLTNDCTWHIKVIENENIRSSASSQNIKGIYTFDDEKSVAIYNVVVRGSNDYRNNGVDGVYYTVNDENKLKLSDFSVFSDCIYKNLFGIKEVERDGKKHYYFMSKIVDNKAKYEIDVISYNNPAYADKGLSCASYRVCDSLKDNDVYHSQSIDTVSIYKPFSRGDIQYRIVNSGDVLKITSAPDWYRYVVEIYGTGTQEDIHDFIHITESRNPEASKIQIYQLMSTGIKVWRDTNNPHAIYIRYNLTNYRSRVNITGLIPGAQKIDIISSSDWNTENKTEETKRMFFGNSSSRPDGTPYIRIGHQYFDQSISKPIWKVQSGWVDGNGIKVTVPKSGTWANRPTSGNDIYEGFMYMINDGTSHFPIYAHILWNTNPATIEWYKADGTQYTV